VVAADEASQWRARIPADIDRPEPLAFGLSGRQLLILTPVLLALWAGFLLLKDTVEPAVLAGCAVPVAAVALVVALAQRDGTGIDRLAWSALRWAGSGKRRVGAPDGLPDIPWWAPKAPRGPRLHPLRLPASAITDEGAIDLGERHAAIIACSTVNFHLASGREQDSMITAFAAVLDSLSDPVQIIVQGRAFDLAPLTRRLRADAPRLPHPGLEEAALDHADFLDELQDHRELTQRRVLVVVTTGARGARSAAGAIRAADTLAAALGGIGIRADVCDRETCEQVIRSCFAPAYSTPADTAPEEG
jgi:hypothetical protein